MSATTSQQNPQTKEARLRATQKPEVPQHEAKISKDVLQRLGAMEGQQLWAEHQGRRSELKARVAEVPGDRIELHPEDFKTLGLSEGEELVLRPR